MARISITASASKGSNPFARREVVVERDGENVYLELPQTAGVIDKASATAFAEGLFAAVGVARSMGVEAPTTLGIPTGWYLKEVGDGFTLCDLAGVVQFTFTYEPRFVMQA